MILPPQRTTNCCTKSALERSGVDLDALPGRGENARDLPAGGSAALQLAGDSTMLPGQTVVVGEAEVAVLDVVILGVHAGGRFEKSGSCAGGVEEEDASGFGIDKQARVAVSVQARSGAHNLLPSPGLPVIHAAADQQVDGAGQVIKVRPTVIGSQKRALYGDRESWNPVLAVSAVAADCQDALY
jgi:hypothetical protein